MPKCTNCEQPYVEGTPLAGGCWGIYSNQEECKIPERKDRAWRIGRALFRNLTNRRGIKQEIDACDLDVQAEIIETLGKIAEAAYQEPEGG